MQSARGRGQRQNRGRGNYKTTQRMDYEKEAQKDYNQNLNVAQLKAFTAVAKQQAAVVKNGTARIKQQTEIIKLIGSVAVKTNYEEALEKVSTTLQFNPSELVYRQNENAVIQPISLTDAPKAITAAPCCDFRDLPCYIKEVAEGDYHIMWIDSEGNGHYNFKKKQVTVLKKDADDFISGATCVGTNITGVAHALEELRKQHSEEQPEKKEEEELKEEEKEEVDMTTTPKD